MGSSLDFNEGKGNNSIKGAIQYKKKYVGD